MKSTNNQTSKQAKKSNWSRIGSDIDKRLGKIIRQNIKGILDMFVTITEMKKIWAIGMLIAIVAGVFLNSGLMGNLIAGFKGVTLPLAFTLLGKKFVITKHIAGLSIAIFLEGMIGLGEVNHNKTLAEFFTLLSIGFLVYAWHLENSDYSRLIIGIIPIVATFALGRMAISKDKVKNYTAIGLLTLARLEIKWIFLKLTLTFAPKSLKKFRPNYLHIEGVYKIKRDKFRKALMKRGLYDARYFKQLPSLDRGRPKKSNPPETGTPAPAQ